MVVEVTARDIKSGNFRNAWECAIARSLRRAFKTSAINCYDIFLIGPYLQEVIAPQVCMNFVDAQDAGLSVAPFSFEIPNIVIKKL